MTALWVGQRREYVVDATFMKYSQLATERSGMDEFRKWNLWESVKQASKLPAGAILEVGCGRGGSSLIIGISARLSGIQDEMFLCDTFAGIVKADAARDRHKDGDMADTSPKEVMEFMVEQGIGGVTVCQGIFPEMWPTQFDPQFRFAHLDVDVYRSMKEAWEWVWPRMVHGGLVVIDDYGQPDCPGVTDFVEESLRLPDAVWMRHGGGQALAVRL